MFTCVGHFSVRSFYEDETPPSPPRSTPCGAYRWSHLLLDQLPGEYADRFIHISALVPQPGEMCVPNWAALYCMCCNPFGASIQVSSLEDDSVTTGGGPQ